MTIRHVFTNAIPDGTNTQIVRPSDWNSVHNLAWTLTGNTAGVSTVSGSNIVLAGGPNVTLSAAQGADIATVSISGGAGGAGNTGYLSAGTTNASLGTVSFANSNGVSFGIDGQTVTATVRTDYLTTAMASNRGSDFVQATAAFNGTNASGTIASNAISVSVAAQTNQTAGIYAVGNTTGQSSSSTYDARTLSVDGAGIVSAGWSNGTLRISATQSNQAFSADASSTFQTLSLQNSNGISFSNNAGAIRLTHDLQFTSATSAITSAALHTSVGGRIYVTAQSTGQSSSSSYDLRTLSIVPDGIISAGWSNGSFRISATQSNQAFSAGAASSTFQTLSFQDSNGISFSNNAGAIRATYTRNAASNAIQAVGSASGSGTNTSRFAADDHVHPGVFSVGVSNVGNTAGDTRVDVGRFVLAGGANITLSQATAANALNTISIVGATAAPSPVNFSAGTTSNNLGSVVFSNSNGVSFGLNGSTITASVNAGGGATATMWFPFNEGVNMAVAPGQGSFHIAPVPQRNDELHIDRVAFPVNISNASNSTGSITLTFLMGLYTKNVNTLSVAYSTSLTTNWTFSGTNSASLHHGIKLFTIPWTTTIVDDRYYVGVGYRSTTGGANATASQIGLSQMNSNFSGVHGVASNRSAQWPLGFGIYSASTTGVPASIGFSQIDGTASVAARPPTWFMISSTA